MPALKYIDILTKQLNFSHLHRRPGSSYRWQGNKGLAFPTLLCSGPFSCPPQSRSTLHENSYLKHLGFSVSTLWMPVLFTSSSGKDSSRKSFATSLHSESRRPRRRLRAQLENGDEPEPSNHNSPYPMHVDVSSLRCYDKARSMINVALWQAARTGIL